MNTTFHQINQKAHDILSRELTPVEYMTFYQQYGLGQGDYTRERQESKDDPSIQEIVKRVNLLLNSQGDSDK